MPAITDFTAGYAITPRLDHPIIGSQHQIRDAETKFQAQTRLRICEDVIFVLPFGILAFGPGYL